MKKKTIDDYLKTLDVDEVENDSIEYNEMDMSFDTVDILKSGKVVNIVDGSLHGDQMSYHKNNKPKKKCFYIMGELHGMYKEWFNNGNMKCDAVYNNGKRHGTYNTYHRSGNLLRTAKFNNGSLDFTYGEYAEYSDIGTLVSDMRSVEDGGPVKYAMTTYDEDSRIDGEIKYNQHGSPVTEDSYVGGILNKSRNLYDSETTLYFTSGRIKSITTEHSCSYYHDTVKNGKKGSHTIIDGSINTGKVIEYAGNVDKTYLTDDVVESTCEYVDVEKHGFEHIYANIGDKRKVLRTRMYRSGTLQWSTSNVYRNGILVDQLKSSYRNGVCWGGIECRYGYGKDRCDIHRFRSFEGGNLVFACTTYDEYCDMLDRKTPYADCDDTFKQQKQDHLVFRTDHYGDEYQIYTDDNGVEYRLFRDGNTYFIYDNWGNERMVRV